MIRGFLPLVLAGCAATSAEQQHLEDRIEAWRGRFAIDRAGVFAQRCGEPWLAVGNADADEVFAVASASKWVSAGVFLALHEQGRFDLDAPLHQALPDLPAPARDATTRQVLNHTAGFRAHHDCIEDREGSLAACARAIASDAPVRPGVAFRYGNAGWTVAAAAAESATGEPFGTLLDQTLAGPLGLEHTGYGADPDAPNPGIAGDLRTTPNDTLAFLQTLLDHGVHEGQPVLSPASVDAMFAGPVVPRTGFVPPTLAVAPAPIYGLGAWLDHKNAEGEVVVASAIGKFGYQAWIDRERGVAGVLAVELHGDQLRASRPQPDDVRALVASVADALPPCGAN